MTNNKKKNTSQMNWSAELRKRKREAIIVVFLILSLLVLTWVKFRFTQMGEELPFSDTIFFFGLVNLNFILLLVVLFLIFRNVVKIFVERRGRLIASSLRAKLIVAFVAFSFVPTVFMFLISVFYINSSFDKWFNVKTGSVLKSALEVTDVFYNAAKDKNQNFAEKVAKKISLTKEEDISRLLQQSINEYSVDAIEYYEDIIKDPTVVVSESINVNRIPRVSLEFLKKSLLLGHVSSTIHHFSKGNLIRVIVPVEEPESIEGAVVISSYIPTSLLSKIDDISTTYSQFREDNPLEYPLKSIYLVILVLMTLVILLAATWFGFHLAKQLSTPLSLLGRAARRVSKGQYKPVEIQSGSDEMHQLVTSFNTMMSELEKSEEEIRKKNSDLNEYSHYINVVLSNVMTGVLSLDSGGRLTAYSQYAEKLLKIDLSGFVGKKLIDILPKEHRPLLKDMVSALKKYKGQTLEKEVSIKVIDEMRTFQVTLSSLKDPDHKNVGLIIVFDDLTDMISAQRKSAWTEVARRIAHEIKNPLTPIRLAAQRLEKKFGENVADPAFSKCTQTIINEVDGLKELVNEFGEFARLPQAKMQEADFHKLIDEVLVLYRTGYKRVQFEFEKDVRLPSFLFDPYQIKRVLMNLIENAIAATKGKEAPSVAIKTQYDNMQKLVQVEVLDNGAGIPVNVREQIFEPYYSTKDVGTGLGLAIVRKIISDHHGEVKVVPHKPCGTRIIFEIPVRISKKENIFEMQNLEMQ